MIKTKSGKIIREYLAIITEGLEGDFCQNHYARFQGSARQDFTDNPEGEHTYFTDYILDNLPEIPGEILEISIIDLTEIPVKYFSI